jgi:hypothetical protein
MVMRAWRWFGWLAIWCIIGGVANAADSPPPPAYPPPPPAYPLTPPAPYPPPPPAPPWYAPPPAATAPPPGLRGRRFFVLAFLGAQAQEHAWTTSYDPGLRGGALAGRQLGEVVSLNAELTVDTRTAHPSDTPRFNEILFEVAFSPLFRLPLEPVDLVLGVKAGLFGIGANNPSATDGDYEPTRGAVVGARAGLFAPVSRRVSLGGMLSFELRRAVRSCDPALGAPSCNSSVGNNSTNVKAVGLTGGVLF